MSISPLLLPDRSVTAQQELPGAAIRIKVRGDHLPPIDLATISKFELRKTTATNNATAANAPLMPSRECEAL
jgi:hypothetical protein